MRCVSFFGLKCVGEWVSLFREKLFSRFFRVMNGLIGFEVLIWFSRELIVIVLKFFFLCRFCMESELRCLDSLLLLVLISRVW